MTLEQIKEQFSIELETIGNLKELEALRVKFIGKTGLVTDQFKNLKSLQGEQKSIFGKVINELREFITGEIAGAKEKLEQKALNERLEAERIDVTLPARNYSNCKAHVISSVLYDVIKSFEGMGFTHIQDCEMDNEWNNFTALNIPEYHPARQMADTFYVKDQAQGDDKMLLRTHTSNVQIRHMSSNKPPYKIISTGRVYRSDHDATHTPMFHQVEGLYIDKAVTIQHLKGCLEDFLCDFFELQDIPARLRPSYFPFTEPSLELDIQCDMSSKKEIKIASGDDWLEILGCGMVHENVLKNVGVDPEEYQGFAFGIGIERIAMLKYNIPDLRNMFESDIRWLKHYGVAA